MNRLIRIALVLPVLYTFIQGSVYTPTCVTVTYSKNQPDGTYSNAIEYSSGVAMTAAQKCAMQAAIEMIEKWEQLCGFGTANGAQSSVSKNIKELMDRGGVCAEAAGSKPTAATTKRTNSVNGDGGDGVYWSYTGPNVDMNISPDYLPPSNPAGTVVVLDGACAGKTYDEIPIAELAIILIHESSHITNPPDVSTKCEYEQAAYEFSFERLCPLLSCPDVSQDVKRTICTYLAKANELLCRECCFAPMPCDACNDLGITWNPTCECTPPIAVAAPGSPGSLLPPGRLRLQQRGRPPCHRIRRLPCRLPRRSCRK